MGRFFHKREFYIPKRATKISAKDCDAVCYFAPFVKKSTGQSLFHLVGFAGKAEKPSINWTIRNVKELERTIAEFFASRKGREDRAEKNRAERKAFAHSVTVGDIYRTSWGYDQTNVEFFEVVEVKGKYAILREIESASSDDGKGSERCVPQSGAFVKPRYDGDERGLPIRRLIQDGHIKIDDHRYGWPWGKRVAGVIVGESCHRTASGWGH